MVTIRENCRYYLQIVLQTLQVFCTLVRVSVAGHLQIEHDTTRATRKASGIRNRACSETVIISTLDKAVFLRKMDIIATKGHLWSLRTRQKHCKWMQIIFTRLCLVVRLVTALSCYADESHRLPLDWIPIYRRLGSKNKLVHILPTSLGWKANSTLVERRWN